LEERQQFTAKTEDQALERAERILGLDRSNMQWSVLHREKGFLGLGSSVTIEVVVSDQVQPGVQTTPSQHETTADTIPTSASASVADTGKDKSTASPSEPAHQQKRNSENGNRPFASDDEDPVWDQHIQQAQEVGTGLLAAIGYPASVDVSRSGRDHIFMQVAEEAAGLADTGRETIDSFQFLMNKIVNRFPPRYRIIVRVDGTSEKLDQELATQAGEWVQKALDTGREFRVNQSLNPRDRRIVHMEVAKVEGVASRSDGMGRNRRIHIYREN